jgi:predicted  nucleic acid-binding Zn-ribbon protein
MLPDLERLIELQRLDSTAADGQRRIAEAPERRKEFDARLERASRDVAGAKDRLTANQNARRALEKDVAVHQGRLSKFRDQLMEVKTNVEYQAAQKEITFAQAEVKKLEDGILELMVEADDLSAAVKRAEAALGAEQKAVDGDGRALAAELAALDVSLTRAAEERARVLAALAPEVLAIYESLARRRNGIAVAQARDGICTICHVRLRPQVFNTIRRNDGIVQCDSCQRILFYVAPPLPGVDGASQPAPQP